MTSKSSDLPEAIAPTAADTELARESSRQLLRLLDKCSVDSSLANIKLRIQTNEDSEEVIIIPRSAFQLLATILTQMAYGNTVTLMPSQAELTTQQAADFLNVSRPFLMGLLEEGKIPFHQVGIHPRIRFEDLLTYKQDIDQKRLQALEELAREAQEFDMGYGL